MIRGWDGFPIISEMYEDMPQSVGALYIAPLKSLINDQFSRLDELLDLTGIPVFHWHGDVSTAQKAKFLKNPTCVLQITPESLESMLINRKNDIPRISFGSEKFVNVLDQLVEFTKDKRAFLSPSSTGQTLTCRPGASTKERAASRWAHMGVMSIFSASGSTRGPPAAME